MDEVTVQPGVVTVAIPVYTRLQYLAGALRSVAAQDYPHIELIVSDNGCNDGKVEQLVRDNYEQPYRIRRTAGRIPITEHYNELVAEASGEYFLLLADDDELVPGYLSALVAAFHRDATTSVGLAELEVIDAKGQTVPRNLEGRSVPARLAGEDLVRMWCRGEYPFVCFTTFLARTADVRALGGYPEFPRGTSVDNALLLKLALGRTVAFDTTVRFRYRVYETSHGLSLPIGELARDLRLFLEFLDRDPALTAAARASNGEWPELKQLLVRMTWKTYWLRWRKMYRARMETPAWIRAAFEMPWITEYYLAVARVLVQSGMGAVKRRLIGSSKPIEV
jgi:glycosyltransferase involved in cell wall biosynthesis